MQLLVWGRITLKYFETDVRFLDREVSGAAMWRGAAVALGAGVLAGVLTLTELVHTVPS